MRRGQRYPKAEIALQVGMSDGKGPDALGGIEEASGKRGCCCWRSRKEAAAHGNYLRVGSNGLIPIG